MGKKEIKQKVDKKKKLTSLGACTVVLILLIVLFGDDLKNSFLNHMTLYGDKVHNSSSRPRMALEPQPEWIKNDQ